MLLCQGFPAGGVPVCPPGTAVLGGVARDAVQSVACVRSMCVTCRKWHFNRKGVTRAVQESVKYGLSFGAEWAVAMVYI